MAAIKASGAAAAAADIPAAAFRLQAFDSANIKRNCFGGKDLSHLELKSDHRNRPIWIVFVACGPVD
ncbi:MAG: hypothetical protein MHMPM18_003297 [Marteilia pararefringens]